MFKKKKLLIAFLCVLSFLYSFALIRVGMYLGALKMGKAYQSIAAARYLIKEYNNTIVVFEYGSDIPQKVLSIDISRLRKHDRQRFKEGIIVNSLQELAQLEEDFCS